MLTLDYLTSKRAELAALILTLTFIEGKEDNPLSNQLRQHAYLKGQLDLLGELISAFDNPETEPEEV